MARDAIYSLLKNDATLATLGGTGFTVEPNFTGDQRPNGSGAFMVIRWGPTDYDRAVQGNASHHFDLWVHFPAALSDDYVRIDDMIDRCDELFRAANDSQPTGADGWILDEIDFEGRSGDFEDQGYQTICRRASYKALSHKAS